MGKTKRAICGMQNVVVMHNHVDGKKAHIDQSGNVIVTDRSTSKVFTRFHAVSKSAAYTYFRNMGYR